MSKTLNLRPFLPPGSPGGQPDEIRALRELARSQADNLSSMSRLAYNARMALLDHDLELLRSILDEIAGIPDALQLELPSDGNSPRAGPGGHRP